MTSAYYLAKAGHQVTVIDRQAGPALETSFANAGEVSPGYASPWAAPGIPQKAIKWLFMKHAPLILHPMLDPATVRWVLAMLRNCTAARYAVNKGRMVRLAEYSRDCLIELRAETGIAYDHRTQGTLQVFRTQKQLDGIGKDIEVLGKDGVPFEVLDAAGCVAAEPGLGPVKEKIVGGLRLPHDETGDCFKFTTALHRLCETLGVAFRFGVAIRGLRREGPRIVAVETAAGDIEADLYVVALGSYSPALVKPLGLDLPVYPVKGYSITVPIINRGARARLHRDGRDLQGGDHPPGRPHPRRRHGGDRRLQPRSAAGAARDAGAFGRGSCSAAPAIQTQARFWAGLRPMTPDGTPVIGATRYANLYPQRRARHARLDHVLRFRPRARRSGQRCEAGHREPPISRSARYSREPLEPFPF